MKRLLTGALASGGLVLAAAAPAAAGQSQMYHTITSSLGYAVLSQTHGCERTDVFVSSSVAMYAAQPGPVGKQGLTAVDFRVVDTCASAAPAAGGGGVVLFEADGQNGARLLTDNRLTFASVETVISGTDRNGDPVSIAVSAQWTPTGPLEHVTSHSHVNLGEGNVSSAANDLRRPVSAQVSASVAGRSASGTASEATLEQTKNHCIEIARPGVEEFYPCFGFPG